MADAAHKRERFVVLSGRRVEQVAKDLDLIANLSNANYSWEPTEVKAMFRAIRKSVDSAEDKFKRTRRWKEHNA